MLPPHARDLPSSAASTRRPGPSDGTAPAAAPDPVTLLLTTRGLRDAAVGALAEAHAGAPLSAAVVDVDGFRELNARHGFEAGDHLLAELARAARSITRASDLVARTGADELSALFPGQPPAAASRFAARLMEAATGHDPSVRLSAGVATHAPEDSLAELLGAAHGGLDLARSAGGGRTEAAPPRGLVAHDAPQTRALETLAIVLARRDRYEERELRETAVLAREVAAQLGLSSVDADRVAAAVTMRHIGKVAVPDHVLQKPGQLTPGEWQLVRQHPIVAERILRAVPGMDQVARIVRHQHEHWNGDGYPDGLEGQHIPLASRIVHAVDLWGALRSERPYRAARTHAAAVRELTESAGRQLDPRVAERLLSRLYWGARGA